MTESIHKKEEQNYRLIVRILQQIDGLKAFTKAMSEAEKKSFARQLRTITAWLQEIAVNMKLISGMPIANTTKEQLRELVAELQIFYVSLPEKQQKLFRKDLAQLEGVLGL